MVLAVRPKLASGTQIPFTPVRYWHFPNSCQWIQRFARFRWSSSIHDREIGRSFPTSKESHLLQQDRLAAIQGLRNVGKQANSCSGVRESPFIVSICLLISPTGKLSVSVKSRHDVRGSSLWCFLQVFFLRIRAFLSSSFMQVLPTCPVFPTCTSTITGWLSAVSHI